MENNWKERLRKNELNWSSIPIPILCQKMGINSHSHSRIENSSIPIPIHELKWELIPWMGMVIPIQTQVCYFQQRFEADLVILL